MTCCQTKCRLGSGALLLAGLVGFAGWIAAREADPAPKKSIEKKVDKVHPKEKSSGLPDSHNHLFQLPRAEWKTPDHLEQPLVFVNRNQNPAQWDALPGFWNPSAEKAVDPVGKSFSRVSVKIKVPLGLNSNPPIPVENPMTVDKWRLGKKLYFDAILGSDASMSCASCHDPRKGLTDRRPVSTGIGGARGGVSAPTIFNTGYHSLQFWDGRAASLEEQAQGPVQNAVEMFDGKGDAWAKAIDRLRANPDYVERFKRVFGTLPTRDGAAKAIATYERTIFSGNSIHDRAELAMRKRLEEEESNKIVLLAKDYASVLKAAFATKDANALEALHLDPAKDQGKIAEVAKSLVNGRDLFFGKARCNSCHVGDNFTDNTFHNLGVGVKDGVIPKGGEGRYAAQPVGHKNPDSFGAFKTPTLRHLLGTAPYLHDGSEKTLEQVIDFYDRGGNANAYLDNKMRDEDAERAWYDAKAKGTTYKGPEPKMFDGKAIIPLKLNLTPPEKKDLVLFLRALQGDSLHDLIANRTLMPK